MENPYQSPQSECGDRDGVTLMQTVGILGLAIMAVGGAGLCACVVAGTAGYVNPADHPEWAGGVTAAGGVVVVVACLIDLFFGE